MVASLPEELFASLCLRLHLARGDGTTEAADGGHVRIFLDDDRGLKWFAVGPARSNKPLCSVEEMAQRFPRKRVMAEGLQRLSHAEQIDFLLERWLDLQVMFSPEHLAETLAWHRAAAAALTEKYAKRT